MNARGHLLVICVLLFDFQNVSCNELVQRKYPLSRPEDHDEIPGSFFFTHGDEVNTADEAETSHTKPQFACGDRVLKVFLTHADVGNLRIYGPLRDLLRLDQVAAFCGVSIKTTHADVLLLFRYDSCYVKQKENNYVLSLSWYGTDHVLSCPVSVTPPSVVCKHNAMEITIDADWAADEMSIVLNGEWAPLLYVATECWHRELSNQGELTFSVPYTSCGVNFRDGHFILDLKSKSKMMPLSCPYKPIPVLPVKDLGLSETTQPLPQKQPNVYHKPQTGFPSVIAKQEQAFPVKQQDRAPSLPPRVRWLPKLPSLPGSFNLAVNFPFSLPIPTQPVPLRDPLTSKLVASTPAPTPATVSSSAQKLAPSVQNRHPHHEPMEQEFVDPVTEAPESQRQYMWYPNRFQKPVSSPQSEPSPALEYPFSRTPVSSTSLYRPFGSAQNYNFPRPNPLHVNPSLASLAQYLPPGYFICSYNQPPALPEMFPPPVPNPARPLQYQKPSYPQPDIPPLAPANPDVPPMKGYLQQQLTSVVASPSQHHPFFYQSSYGRQGSTTTGLSPTSPLIPINLQSQTSPYPSYPLQDARPFHSEYYQKPSGSVQQPWSTSHRPVTGLSQESKPLVLPSGNTPEYQTGGDQSLDLYQRSVVHTSGRGISSHPPFQPSQLSTFPISQLRRLDDDVSAENSGFSPKVFFQPRSIAPVPSPQVPKFTDNHRIRSLPPPMPRFFSVKEGAQLPYSQGPSVRGMRNPHVHPERPSEPSSQKPQNDTLPPYQFYRPASQEKDNFGSPSFRSTSQEEVQPPRKASPSESYFYSTSATEADN